MVKLVARYGAGAHQLLADSQTTSRLRFRGSINGQDDIRITTMGIRSLYLGPLCMAVRDYFDGMHDEVTGEKHAPERTRTDRGDGHQASGIRSGFWRFTTTKRRVLGQEGLLG